MSLVRSSINGNRLLAAVPPNERDGVLAACKPVVLTFGTTLSEPNEPIRHVYFPTTSYISLITAKEPATQSLEVGLTGREGMFGATLILGVDVSPLRGLVQGGGNALKMSVKDFRRGLAASPGFAKLLNAYLFVLVSQLAQTAACGRFHLLEARLARWILMTHDRAGMDEFRITHEFLAQMLGVRRAGVTEAAGLIQAKKLIRYRRGIMEILNRRGLEAIACPCYQTFNTIYDRHLHTPRSRRAAPRSR